MFGVFYGDVIGSEYENACTKDYDFPFKRESHFTDDSVMTAAVCRAILNNGEKIGRFGIRKRAFEYAAQYKQYYSRYPHAGYGSMFARWAKEKSLRRQYSYANGGAMRAVPIGYAYDDIEQVMLQAKASCYYTHAHREGIRGAQAVACAVFLAHHGEPKELIRKFIAEKFRYNLSYTIEQIRPEYSFDSSCEYSVPPSIVCFLDSTDYESAVRNAVSLGGDADTMACIAGGIAEAYYKNIPEEIRRFCDSRIDISLKETAREFNLKYINTSNAQNLD